jgi:hypothetical protein
MYSELQRISEVEYFVELYKQLPTGTLKEIKTGFILEEGGGGGN